jgi:hypothetical protein
MLLPNLERNDLWQRLKTPSLGSYTGTALQVLICPSDPPSTTTGVGPSAYIANGLVLRDQYAYSSGSQALAPQTLDYVSSNDGTSTTLMLGENTQVPPNAAATAGATAKAHNWYDCDQATTYTMPTSYLLKQTFGISLVSAGTNYYAAGLMSPFSAAYSSQLTYYNSNTMTANINSAHPNGAVVVFFDNHAQFLRDDVGLNPATGGGQTVFQIMVTPEGSKNGSEPPADESQWAPAG